MQQAGAPIGCARLQGKLIATPSPAAVLPGDEPLVLLPRSQLEFAADLHRFGLLRGPLGALFPWADKTR